MKTIAAYFRELGLWAIAGWDRFWFTPADPATLGLIRILAGAMLFYTHLVWTIDLEAFFGTGSWVDAAAAQVALGGSRGGFAWSYFWLIRSPGVLWTAHFAALAVFALLTLGLFSRTVSILAFLISVSYVNRTPGALFGLDQINIMLAMYLAVGPCGSAFSLDRFLASHRAGRGRGGAADLFMNAIRTRPAMSTGANVAIRLIQLHMCVIYFFAGIAKIQGETWWAGTAIWGAVANLEYQSLDVTWLAGWPLVVAFLTQGTVYWELSFCVLVWPRLLRPLVLVVAVPMHLGIAFCMGMITFGLVMLIGCLSFVPPTMVRRLLRAETPGAAETREEDNKAVRRELRRRGQRRASESARSQ